MATYTEAVLSVFGWDPDVPHLVAGLLPYVIVFCVAALLYHGNRLMLPAALLPYGQDFVKTLAICAYATGHGLVFKYYGGLGYWLCAVPLNSITALLLVEGDASPIAPWVKLLFKQISLSKFAGKLVTQILAGLAAYRFGMVIFSLEIHGDYRLRSEAFRRGMCFSVLNMSCLLGAFVGLAVVFIDCLGRSKRLAESHGLDTVLKFGFDCFLIAVGFPLTGMCLNPALATGSTFGCGDTTPLEHVLVFWAGPFLGAYLASVIIRRGMKAQKINAAKKSN